MANKHSSNWGGRRSGSGRPRRSLVLRVGQVIAVRLTDVDGQAEPLTEYEVVAVLPSAITLRRRSDKRA